MDQLNILLGDYPLTRAFLEMPRLADGTTLKIRNFAETGGARPAMARMIRELPDLDYDICDLPLVNYMSAKEHGAKFTALPVVLTRRFQHGGIWGDERQGIREPKDLEGKRVGLGYHGHTDLTWVRGIMSDVYGVDLHSITWITSDPEGVPDAKLPSNVWQIPSCSFPALVASGVIAGAVLPFNQRFDDPAVRQLVTDRPAAEREWFQTTNVFPQLHTVVVKDFGARGSPDARDGALSRALGRQDRCLCEGGGGNERVGNRGDVHDRLSGLARGQEGPALSSVTTRCLSVSRQTAPASKCSSALRASRGSPPGNQRSKSCSCRLMREE